MSKIFAENVSPARELKDISSNENTLTDAKENQNLIVVTNVIL